jgi:hypothetical protein
MTKTKSRYIPKKIDEGVKKASGFRCAWCGCYLTVRHHIKSFKLTKSHSANNLILLCPSCHTQAHSGKITMDELKERRINLTGKIDRSSGCLSINKEMFRIDVGGNHFINCKNILMFNDTPLVSAINKDGYLLISLRLFNKAGNLICWMSENRWWVENKAILNFKFSKDKFSISASNKTKLLNLIIKGDSVEMSGRMYLLDSSVRLTKDRVVFEDSQNQFIGNTFNNISNAIVIKEKSFSNPILGSTGILMEI